MHLILLMHLQATTDVAPSFGHSVGYAYHEWGCKIKPSAGLFESHAIGSLAFTVWNPRN